MKPRILVIDDEAAIRDSLKMILEYEDYDFLGASSGPEGAAMVKRDAPDLVILDIKMPGMNGLETLREISKLAPAARTVLMTGNAEDARLCEKLDIPLVGKPLDPNELARAFRAQSN